MTVATFADDTLTLRGLGVEFSAEMSELAAKELRDQLLRRYPVEPEATPVAGPLREVTLAEARPGDIATFEVKDSPAEGKFVCTIVSRGNTALYSDKWLTANKRPTWCIRDTTCDEGFNMKDLHIWRWNGVEEAVEETDELPDQPMVAGWYITATSDQVLYNDGDPCVNWSRPKGAKWSTDNICEDWDVVVRDLGPERLPLKLILKKED